MSTQECLGKSLDVVLSEQADHPQYTSVVEHLDNCRSCQSRLDSLAAAPSWWAQTRELLSDSTDLNIPDLPRAETLVLAQVGLSGVSEYGDPATFLDPPRHPEMLGRVGKYEVEREIGRGGMGIVLKGFDSELNRPVAIKLLAPHLASSGTARQRFIREARAAAAVVHDNVVAIHGIENDGPLPAIVMPLISGASLQDHIERHGPMDAVDVVRIGIQVAAGLAAAHEQGLVHRDIKPANILLENELTRVQITDFGLARAAHDANLTRSGVIAGTPHFMSPEQALGDSIDQRSDLFSLGSVLYFMATGQLPFAGSTPMGVLQRVCNEEPQGIRESNSAVPEQLETIIEKLLEKSPANRFESAVDLQNYLREYLAHLQQPTARKAPRKLRTASVRARRRKWAIGTVSGIALLALCVGAGWIAANWRGKPPAPLRLATFASLGVATENQLDKELRTISDELTALESTPHATFRAAGSDDSLGKLAAEVSSLETLRSEGWASTFDREVQSIDAALRRLEQESALATPLPAPFKGQ